VGVIGTGWWATRAHLPALAASPDADLAAIADPDAANLGRAADRFGVARAYGSAEAMLDAERLDAAIVATPHATHARLARACLDRGLHVLVEKPMTVDPADAWDLVARAGAVGRQLRVGYPWHFNRQAVALRDAIAAGRIGRVEMVQCLFASTVRSLYRGDPEPYRDVLGYPVNTPGAATYSDPTVAGGGQGHAQLTHSLALVLFLTDLRPDLVTGLTADFELPVDLADAMAVRFEGGAIGSLGSVGSVQPGQDEMLEIRIFGDAGHVVFDVNTGAAAIHGQEGAVDRLAGLPADDRYPEWAPALDLVAVASGRDGNGTPGELGARVVAAIDGLYRSSAEGRAVTPVGPSAAGAVPVARSVRPTVEAPA
jgi:predicted dehydrogenase